MESVRVEMELQRAFDDVNAAQTMLIDLRVQLIVHDMVYNGRSILGENGGCLGTV